MHAVVDNSNSTCQRTGTMPSNNAIPIILQFQNSVRQESILEAFNDVFIFRSAVAGPVVPCFLPAAVFSVIGGVVRTVAGAFLMVVDICDGGVALLFTVYWDAVFGERAVEYTCLYLVETEPGH